MTTRHEKAIFLEFQKIIGWHSQKPISNGEKSFFRKLDEASVFVHLEIAYFVRFSFYEMKPLCVHYENLSYFTVSGHLYSEKALILKLSILVEIFEIRMRYILRV